MCVLLSQARMKTKQLSSHLIYPLTARAAGPPQMILQPVSSIFPSSPLPSWQTPGLSIPWCCLPTSSSVCLVFFPLSLCLATLALLIHTHSWPVALSRTGSEIISITIFLVLLLFLLLLAVVVVVVVVVLEVKNFVPVLWCSRHSRLVHSSPTKSRKRLTHATHADLVQSVRDTECQKQNGSVQGRGFATFKHWFVTK